MDIFRKIGAILIAILFVITAVFAIISFNFDRRGFTAETYQTAFAKEDFYNQLPTIMAETMVSSTSDQSGFPVVMQGMSAEAWDVFFRSVLPPEALKGMGDSALNSLFAYFDMQTDSAEFPLAPFKASLVSDTGVQAVFALLATQPDCTLAQMGQIALGLISEQEMLLCNPPAELKPLLTPVVQLQLQVTAAALPDQVTIATADQANDPRRNLRTARLIMRLSPLLPLGFLFLLTIFTVRSLKSWLQWWGIPFLSTGLIVTLMSLSGAPVIGLILKRLIISRAPVYLPAAFSNYASDVASAMVAAITRPIFWQGLILFFVGLGMVFILALIYIVRKMSQK